MILRIGAIIAWCAIIVALIAPIVNLQYSNDEWLDEDHPTEVASDRFAEDFEPGETFLIILDLQFPFFSDPGEQLWAGILDIEDQLGQIGRIKSIESPLTARTILQVPPTQEIIDILGDEAENQLDITSFRSGLDKGIIKDRQEYQQLFLLSPYRNKLLSRDGYNFVIKIQADTIGDSDARRQVLQEARAILDESRYHNHVSYVGDAVVRDSINSSIGDNLLLLLVAACLMILLSLYLAGSDFWSSCLIASIGAAAAGISLGATQLLGGVMTAPGIILPTIVATVCVSDALHIVSIWRHHRSEIPSARGAVLATMKSTWLPCLLASISTAIGCGSFVGSEIALLNQFSTNAAIIVIGIYPVLTLSAWAALYLWDTQFSKGIYQGAATLRDSVDMRDGMQADETRMTEVGVTDLATDLICRQVVRNPKNVATTLLVPFIALTIGIILIKTESNFLAVFFDDGNKIRTDFELVDRKLGGSSGIDVLLEYTGPPLEDDVGYFQTEEGYRMLRSTALQLRDLSFVESVESLLLPLRLSHKNIFDQSGLPRNTDQLAQELLFLELSQTEVERSVHAPYIDFDYNTARFSIRTADLLSDELARLIEEINTEIDEEIDNTEQVHVTFTGSGEFLHTIASLILETQFLSVGLTLLFVVLMLLTLFQWRLALAGSLCTILPVLATGGLMAWMGVSYDFGTILVMGITTGLCVDDCLHFLHHFQQKHPRIHRINYEEFASAIDYTIRLTGKPIMMTSIVLVTALLTLALSDLLMIQKFAIFTAFGVIAALISTIILLPAILLLEARTRIHPY